MPAFFFKLLPITLEEFIPIMNKLLINLHIPTDADGIFTNKNSLFKYKIRYKCKFSNVRMAPQPLK